MQRVATFRSSNGEAGTNLSLFLATANNLVRGARLQAIIRIYVTIFCLIRSVNRSTIIFFK